MKWAYLHDLEFGLGLNTLTERDRLLLLLYQECKWWCGRGSLSAGSGREEIGRPGKRKSL
jgi:hypothetical protein